MAALIALAGGAAQADEQQPTAAQLAAAAVAEKPVSEAAVNAPAAERIAAAAEEKPFKPPKGYKLRRARGENVYCTKMTVLGSRFAKEDCRTVAELRQLELQKASMRVEMDQQKHVCTSAPGCRNP
jgi:hypothetical protein